MAVMTIDMAYSADPPKIYHFEPEMVVLEGIIERQTFPGRPGYDSIKNGDEAEQGWYLRMSEPIDVETSNGDTDPHSSTERNVKILQMAIDYGTLPRPIPVGKEVRVKGTLFHGQTGHHHSRILMEVKHIEVSKR